MVSLNWLNKLRRDKENETIHTIVFCISILFVCTVYNCAVLCNGLHVPIVQWLSRRPNTLKVLSSILGSNASISFAGTVCHTEEPPFKLAICPNIDMALNLLSLNFYLFPRDYHLIYSSAKEIVSAMYFSSKAWSLRRVLLCRKTSKAVQSIFEKRKTEQTESALLYFSPSILQNKNIKTLCTA